jgi:lipid-binding SYLF domain-containing protein
MNDQRPTKEQPTEQKAPKITYEPSGTADQVIPGAAKPCGCGPGFESMHDHTEKTTKGKGHATRLGLAAIPLALLLALPAVASTPAGLSKHETETLSDSITVLNEMASAPDKGIPQELLAKADCILIFPNVAKGAFIVGGKGGHGVASCRQSSGKMGSVAFYTVGGASIGFQIGGQTADVVMLIMNEKGVDHLLSDKFTIGGEASATAGPVGRTVQAATDAQMHAQLLTWSRSQGLFAGAALDGSVVKPDKDANAHLYGQATSGREILVDSKLSVPATAKPLVKEIREHMAAAVAQEQAEEKN